MVFGSGSNGRSAFRGSALGLIDFMRRKKTQQLSKNQHQEPAQRRVLFALQWSAIGRFLPDAMQQRLRFSSFREVWNVGTAEEIIAKHLVCSAPDTGRKSTFV